MIGGIDLGGTKIEARVFDGHDARTVTVRRIPTPRDSFDALLTALMAQIDWLEGETGDAALPIGVAVPGLIDPATGKSFAANVPITGHDLARALEQARGRPFTVVNDCMAFTYSEARGGAAPDTGVVMGLILGTGVGGGLCIDGALPDRHAGLAVEIGHIGVSASVLDRHGLPLFSCGCGRRGCVETYLSGNGLSNIAAWKTGTRTPAQEVTSEEVLGIWVDVAGDTLATIQNILDPHCIVLGGGVSNMAGLVDRLSAALGDHRLSGARAPLLTLAQHGDSSGARGAALLASTRGGKR